MLCHRLRMGILALLAGVPFSAGGAAALEVDDVVIAAEELGSAGWFFEVEIEGTTDLSAAAITPPGQSERSFGCEVFGTSASCEFEDPPLSMGGFASLTQLLGTWPAGTYTVAVSDGVNPPLTANVTFDPVAPDGTMNVTSPIDGEANVSPTPTVTYTHDCTNCTHFFLDIETEVGPGMFNSVAEFETPETTSPNNVPLSSFTDPEDMPVANLPDGDYILFGGLGNLSETPGVAFNEDPAKTFFFETGAEHETDAIMFTVPEPSSRAAGAVVMAVLGLLALRRRGWI